MSTEPSLRTRSLTCVRPFELARVPPLSRNLIVFFLPMNRLAGMWAHSASPPVSPRSWRKTSCVTGGNVPRRRRPRLPFKVSLVLGAAGRRLAFWSVSACASPQHAGSSKSTRPLPSSSVQLPQISTGGGGVEVVVVVVAVDGAVVPLEEVVVLVVVLVLVVGGMVVVLVGGSVVGVGSPIGSPGKNG